MNERFGMFTVLITRIGRSIRHLKTEEMAEFQLKSTHLSCLYYLYSMGSLTAKELCELCAEDKSSVSRSLEYLEEHGYLVCVSKAKKRYNAGMELTDRGREVARALEDRIDRVLEQAGAGLPPEDRQILYRSLALIDANLQSVCEQCGHKSEELTT